MKENYKIDKLLQGNPPLPFISYYLTTDNKEDKKYLIIDFKLQTKTKNEKEDMLEQIGLLKKLDHPNVIKIKEAHINENVLNVITEFTDGGRLLEKIEEQKNIGPFPETQILDYFIQICLALRILQKNKIEDFRLKSENIFLTKSGIVKLGYFHIPIGRKDAINVRCIPIVPEVIHNKSEKDIWLLGELLYELLTFKEPFDEKGKSLLRTRPLVKYPPPPEIYSTEIKDLLKKCLTLQPLSINDILQLPIIKDRINNFLNDVQYDQDLYTIIAKLYKDIKKKGKQKEDKEKQTNEDKKLVTDKKLIFKKKLDKKEKKVESKQEPIEKINKTNFLSQKKDPNFQKGKIYKEDEIGKALNAKGYFDLIDEKTGNFDVNKMDEDQYNQLRLLNNMYKVLNNQVKDLDSD